MKQEKRRRLKQKVKKKEILALMLKQEKFRCYRHIVIEKAEGWFKRLRDLLHTKGYNDAEVYNLISDAVRLERHEALTPGEVVEEIVLQHEREAEGVYALIRYDELVGGGI
ncbi:hypothetical protein ES708_16974 [subsurface metagenome]